MRLNITRLGQGMPLVFFHGWGFDHSIWYSLASRLRESYQIYLVDLPGYGNSSEMSWCDFKQALLERLPEQFVIMGWSMGGLYATRLALETPERVGHLVNVCSSPRFIQEDNWPGIKPAQFAKFLHTLVNKPQTVLQQFVDLQLKGTAYQYNRQFTPSHESLNKGLQILSDWDLRKPLLNFTNQTSFVFGRLDAIISPRTLTVMKESYPQFHYYQFASAAHIPFLSHPDEFITYLRLLLRSK